MARRVADGARLFLSLRRCNVRGPEVRVFRATVRALTASPLPAPQDVEIAIPPVLRAWARRVGTLNLWVLFRFDAERVVVLWVTREPPVPMA